jgi:hypothetical protein
MTALPPAGWYPDPEAGGTTWRWWDGTRWSPPTPTPAFGFDRGVAPAAVADRYRKGTRTFGYWLRWAMLASLLSSIGFWVVAALAFRGKAFDFGPSDAGGGPQFGRGFFALQLVSLPLNVFVLGHLGLLIAWIAQAGKFAEARGWPAARDRTLGAVSVIIPIVNLWWPYEAVRDAYPPGSSPSFVLKWWVSYLVTPILGLPVFFVTLFGTPVEAVVAIGIAVGAVMIPVRLGWKLIRDVEAMQRADTPAPS